MLQAACMPGRFCFKLPTARGKISFKDHTVTGGRPREVAAARVRGPDPIDSYVGQSESDREGSERAIDR